MPPGASLVLDCQTLTFNYDIVATSLELGASSSFGMRNCDVVNFRFPQDRPATARGTQTFTHSTLSLQPNTCKVCPTSCYTSP